MKPHPSTLLALATALLCASAAMAKDPASCASLGTNDQPRHLSNGKSFALPDSPEAKTLSVAQLTCAADRGDPAAQLALGVRYDEGNGVAADPARSARLYESAERNIERLYAINSPPVRSGRFAVTRTSGLRPPPPALAEARYKLARLYLDGRGVAKNRGTARRLLILSARQGYEPALSLLKDKMQVTPGAVAPEKKDGLE